MLEAVVVVGVILTAFGATPAMGINPGLPPMMLGSWSGVPTTTVLGPWVDDLTFNIHPLTDGSGFLVEDFFTGVEEPGSWQHWWVQGDLLTYCGILAPGYYTNGTEPPAAAHMVLKWQRDQSTDTKAVFCTVNPSSPDTQLCDKMVQYSFDLVDNDTLAVLVTMASPAVHLDVVFKRNPGPSPAPVPPGSSGPGGHSCTFPSDQTSAVYGKLPAAHIPLEGLPLTSRCPYEAATRRTNYKAAAPQAAPVVGDGFDHCYLLNHKLGLTLSWTLDASAGLVTIKVAASNAPAGASYIAIGFGPELFTGMKGADVVLGYLTSSGKGCVRPLYAPEVGGMPVAPAAGKAVSVADASVTWEDSTLSLTFTRKIASGQRPIVLRPNPTPLELLQDPDHIMWAVGPAGRTMESCDSSFPYHDNNRAFHPVEWMKPEAVFLSSQKCA